MSSSSKRSSSTRSAGIELQRLVLHIPRVRADPRVARVFPGEIGRCRADDCPRFIVIHIVSRLDGRKVEGLLTSAGRCGAGA